jgi:hypothetical protein
MTDTSSTLAALAEPFREASKRLARRLCVSHECANHRQIADDEREFAEAVMEELSPLLARLVEQHAPAGDDAGRLREALKELFDAMVRYEGDVDGDVPSHHGRMMDRVRAALSGSPAPEPAADAERGRLEREVVDALDEALKNGWTISAGSELSYWSINASRLPQAILAYRSHVGATPAAEAEEKR